MKQACYIIERGHHSRPGVWESKGEFVAGSPWRDGRPVNDDTMREEVEDYRKTWSDFRARVRCPNGEILAERPPSCEIERISTGAPCGRPADVVWVCGDKRTPICRECSRAVSVCGGKLEELPHPVSLIGEYVTVRIKGESFALQGWVIANSPLRIKCQNGEEHDCGGVPRVCVNPPDRKPASLP